MMTFIGRMLRAARLDPRMYHAVGGDPTVTTQALAVVAIAALSNGAGVGLAAVLGGSPRWGLVAVRGVLGELLTWGAWWLVTYLVGAHLLASRATPGMVLRALGFAQSPGALLVLRFIPALGTTLNLFVDGWRIAAGFVAVRSALRLDTARAVVALVIGVLAGILALLVWLAATAPLT